MGETQRAGQLGELVHRSYELFATAGVDAWIEQMTVPDFIWDVTPMGLGRYEGRARFREFYEEWVGSYDGWSIELERVEEVASDVAVNAVRQVGKVRDSEQTVELRFVQVGVWEGSRLKMVVNYLDLEEARAAATELVASG